LNSKVSPSVVRYPLLLIINHSPFSVYHCPLSIVHWSPFIHTGAVIGGLNTRRGTITDSEVREEEFTAIAEVALNDMFGYSNQLRGSTQGKGISVLVPT